MKVESTCVILGLLIIFLLNETQCVKIKKIFEATKANATTSLNALSVNAVKLRDNPNVVNTARVVAGSVIPFIRPEVVSKICDAISTTGFSFYDGVQLKNAETLKQEEEDKKVAELHEFRKNVTTGITNLGKQLHAETDRIINVVEKSFEKLEDLLSILTNKLIGKLKNFYAAYDLVEDLRMTLNSFDQYYENYDYCLLKIGNCKDEIRKNIVKYLIDPGPFSDSLATFVDNFIDKTDKLRTSATHNQLGFFDYVLEEKRRQFDEERDCDMATSQYQIYKLYVYITSVISKVHSMVLAARMIRSFDEPKYKTSAEEQTKPYIDASKKFNNVILTISKKAQDTLSQLSTEIRACDPRTNHKKGVTYDKINLEEKVYIGYLYYKVPMADGTIDYVHTFIADHPNSTEWYRGRKINKTTKLGKIHDKWVPLYNCQYDKDSLVDMYPWEESKIEYTYDPFDDSELFYNMKIFRPDGFKKYGNDKLLENQTLNGQKMNGPSEDTNFTRCEHSKPKLPGNLCPLVYRCPVNSSIYPPLKAAQQHLSLLPVTVDDGYVATGIRWRNRNKILYLELKQGLYKDGQVNASTVAWKPTPEHNISSGKTVMIREGKGFMLDDVKLPPGYAVTGVQFQWDKQDLIGIEVQGKSFETKKTERARMNLSPTLSSKLDISGADFPENAKYNNITSRSGKHHVYIQRIGSIENDNRAFIPYLDIQSVETKQPAILEGIGIYYTGMKGYGGFIGLRAFGQDYAKMITVDKIEQYNDAMNKIYGVGLDLLQTKGITNSSTVVD